MTLISFFNIQDIDGSKRQTHFETKCKHSFIVKTYHYDGKCQTRAKHSLTDSHLIENYHLLKNESV